MSNITLLTQPDPVELFSVKGRPLHAVLVSNVLYVDHGAERHIVTAGDVEQVTLKLASHSAVYQAYAFKERTATIANTASGLSMLAMIAIVSRAGLDMVFLLLLPASGCAALAYRRSKNLVTFAGVEWETLAAAALGYLLLCAIYIGLLRDLIVTNPLETLACVHFVLWFLAMHGFGFSKNMDSTKTYLCVCYIVLAPFWTKYVFGLTANSESFAAVAVPILFVFHDAINLAVLRVKTWLGL